MPDLTPPPRLINAWISASLIGPPLSRNAAPVWSLPYEGFAPTFTGPGIGPDLAVDWLSAEAKYRAVFWLPARADCGRLHARADCGRLLAGKGALRASLSWV